MKNPPYTAVAVRPDSLTSAIDDKGLAMPPRTLAVLLLSSTLAFGHAVAQTTSPNAGPQPAGPAGGPASGAPTATAKGEPEGGVGAGGAAVIAAAAAALAALGGGGGGATTTHTATTHH